MQTETEVKAKGPSINYVVSRGEGGRVKICQFYLVKRRLRGGEGVKNRRFWDDIVYGRTVPYLATSSKSSKAAQPTEMDTNSLPTFTRNIKFRLGFTSFFWRFNNALSCKAHVKAICARKKKFRLGFTSFSRLNHSAHLTTETEVKAKRNSFRRFNDTTNQLKWMQFICRINCTNKKVGIRKN